MKRLLWYGLIALVAAGGAFWIWANRLPVSAAGQSASGLLAVPAIGHPAPDITLTTLQGETFKLSDLRGKPVILNFWATWCPPCRGELPQLQAASRRYAGQVAVIGVDQAEPVGIVSKMTGELGITYPVPLDDAGKASQAFAVRSLPTTYFIDRDGVIRQIQIGGLTEATLAGSLHSIYP